MKSLESLRIAVNKFEQHPNARKHVHWILSVGFQPGIVTPTSSDAFMVQVLGRWRYMPDAALNALLEAGFTCGEKSVELLLNRGDLQRFRYLLRMGSIRMTREDSPLWALALCQPRYRHALKDGRDDVGNSYSDWLNVLCDLHAEPSVQKRSLNAWKTFHWDSRFTEQLMTSIHVALLLNDMSALDWMLSTGQVSRFTLQHPLYDTFFKLSSHKFTPLQYAAATNNFDASLALFAAGARE